MDLNLVNKISAERLLALISSTTRPNISLGGGVIFSHVGFT